LPGRSSKIAENFSSHRSRVFGAAYISGDPKAAIANSQHKTVLPPNGPDDIP
jgi:hypothetical protein